jgi:hypothetical protein
MGTPAASSFDFAGEQDAAARTGRPGVVRLGRFLPAGEDHFDLGRDSHPVEVLFPRAAPDRVVHQHDEVDAQGSPPPDDDLSMDQPIVYPIQQQAHPGTWMAF